MTRAKNSRTSHRTSAGNGLLTVLADSEFRVRPGEPLQLTKNGKPASPDKVYALAFDGALFPQPVSPSGN